MKFLKLCSILFMIGLYSCKPKAYLRKSESIEKAVDYYADEGFYKNDNEGIIQEQSLKFISYESMIVDLISKATIFPINNINADLIVAEFKKSKYEWSKIDSLQLKLLEKTLYIVNDENFKFYGKSGLAYVWGGKDYNKLRRPENYDDKPNICEQDLYGLDCSGLIYQIFNQSGVKLGIKRAATYSNTQPFKQPLSDFFNCNDCFTVNAFNLNQPISMNLFQTGDIVYFYRGAKIYHIGISFKFKNKVLFFESTGSPSKGCDYNIKLGPRAQEFTEDYLNGKHGVGIVRLSSKR